MVVEDVLLAERFLSRVWRRDSQQPHFLQDNAVENRLTSRLQTLESDVQVMKTMKGMKAMKGRKRLKSMKGKKKNKKAKKDQKGNRRK